jgi:hypothetical protein
MTLRGMRWLLVPLLAAGAIMTGCEAGGEDEPLEDGLIGTPTAEADETPEVAATPTGEAAGGQMDVEELGQSITEAVDADVEITMLSYEGDELVIETDLATDAMDIAEQVCEEADRLDESAAETVVVLGEDGSELTRCERTGPARTD